MSVNDQLKNLANDFAANRITRRDLWKGAAALGLSGTWIAALEKGAIAGPAPVHSQLKARGQDRATTLIIAVAENVDTFDPGFTVGSKTAQTVIQNTFDQLTQYEIVEKTAPDGTVYKTVNTENIVPMLAETYTVEGADMIFTTRANATFADGTPIDSATMVTGYSRIIESGSISALLLGMGAGVTESSQFTAPDASTFKISMSVPNTLTPLNNVMHNTSLVNPVEMEANATAEDPWATTYFKATLGIGNGPYKLDSYVPDDSLVLVANEAYYGEQPAFTTVILKIVADATQRLQLLTTGDVDTATKIPVKDYASLAENPDIKILSLPTTLVVMLELNNTIAPFDVKEVRQAIAYATPYTDIIEQIYEGQATEAKSLIPAGMPTSDFSTNAYALDYEKAKELLATAGFPEGEGLPEIKLTVGGDDVQKERTAILVQDSLKNIGITVTIEKLPYAQFNELQQGSKLQMWTDEWISWVNDPFYHLTWLATSTSPTNYPRFNSPRVDELVAEFTMSDDAAAREAASKEAQAIIIDECPYVFLCQPNWIFYSRTDLDGYVYYNDELPRYYHHTRPAV